MADYEPNIAPEHRPEPPLDEPVVLSDRQRKLGEIVAEAFINGEDVSGKALVEAAGYAKNSPPAVILSSKKAQEAISQALFSVDNAQEIVGEIMSNPDNDPTDRLKAADMVFKSYGSYAPEKKINLDVRMGAKVSPEMETVRLKYEEELRLQLSSGQVADKQK